MAHGGNNHQGDFIEFVCKPVEDLYIFTNERRSVRIEANTEYRCSMLRDQHFSSLFRHYGKHNGVDKETLIFFYHEELMQELVASDTPRSIHLRKNDVIVIRHRTLPVPDNLLVQFDLTATDALELIEKFPKARSMQSSDGRTALHHAASRCGTVQLVTQLLLLGCNPSTLDNAGRTPYSIAQHARSALDTRPNQNPETNAKLANFRNLEQLLKQHEFKKQMAVIRAQYDAKRYGTNGECKTPDIISKRACTSKHISHEDEVKHNACLRFLFSVLAHGNQSRNFQRVVCFLYA